GSKRDWSSDVCSSDLCSATDSATSPVAGSCGPKPAVNSRSPLTIAWLYGPAGCGAFSVRRASLWVIVLLDAVGEGIGDAGWWLVAGGWWLVADGGRANEVLVVCVTSTLHSG